MFEELGIKKKKLQTDGKVPKAKTLYFQSYKDIESILKYILGNTVDFMNGKNTYCKENEVWKQRNK